MRTWLCVLLTACAVDHVEQQVPSLDAGDDDAGAEGCAATLCTPYTCDSRFGVCRMTCSINAHCVAGYACTAGFCVGMECTEQSAREVCGPYACVLGECAPTCSSTGCAPGFYCRGDTLDCRPNCTTRNDPECAGFVCDLSVGECEAYCLAGEIECAPGYTCDPNGLCVISQAP